MTTPVAAELVAAWLAELPRDQLERAAVFALHYLAGQLDDADVVELADLERALDAALRMVRR